MAAAATDRATARRADARRARLAFFAVALCAAFASQASADDASGTWTGAVEARGNYYWERSTRVLAPELNASVTSPGGVSLNAHYLIDTITSASQAAGLVADVRFTETRHDFGAGASAEIEVGDLPLQLSGGARLSLEPDYVSRGANVAASLSLNDRATVLSLGANFLHDTVSKILRGANRVSPDGRDLSNRGEVGTLNALALSFGVSQVLTPELTIDGSYDLGLNFGFMSNAYRMVSVDGALRPETHPDQRFRHTVSGRVAYYIRPTRTAVHGIVRAYADSWDVLAITPEVRVYQEIGDSFLVRLRYRHYRQRASYFYQSSYDTGAEYFTIDPKMSAFHSHLVGGQLVLRLDFLERTALDFAWNATLDLSFDYIFNTNRFGDGVIAQAGLRVPF